MIDGSGTPDKERSTFYQDPSLNKQSRQKNGQNISLCRVPTAKLLWLQASFVQMIDGLGIPDIPQDKIYLLPSPQFKQTINN